MPGAVLGTEVLIDLEAPNCYGRSQWIQNGGRRKGNGEQSRFDPDDLFQS